MMAKAERERQVQLLEFQKEQAELNRQHELEMMEIIKLVNPPPCATTNQYRPGPIQMPPPMTPQCTTTGNLVVNGYPGIANYPGVTGYQGNQPQMAAPEGGHFTELQLIHSTDW